MHNRNCLLYSFLFIFVIGYTVDSSTTTPTPPPFITYKCNKGLLTNVSISSNDAKHVVVLTKDGGYCTPAQRTEQGIKACIATYDPSKDHTTDVIKKLTILYEEEMDEDIVGGSNTKYYELSCEEKADTVTAVINRLDVQTPVPTLPNVFHPLLSETPSLKVLEHPGTPYFVGEQITLQMTVKATYKLLPKSCTAYRADNDLQSHTFWENCQHTDTSIISSDSWTQTPDRATLNIVMYAFRFIDTDTLIIKCETIVCPSNDDSACDVDCPSRKRRSANHQKKNATVSIAIKVSDRKFQDNGSQVVSPVWYIYALGLGMIYWITSQKF